MTDKADVRLLGVTRTVSSEERVAEMIDPFLVPAIEAFSERYGLSPLMVATLFSARAPRIRWPDDDD